MSNKSLLFKKLQKIFAFINHAFVLFKQSSHINNWQVKLSETYQILTVFIYTYVCPQGGTFISVYFVVLAWPSAGAASRAASLQNAPVGEWWQMGGAVVWKLSGGGETIWTQFPEKKCVCASPVLTCAPNLERYRLRSPKADMGVNLAELTSVTWLCRLLLLREH